MTYGKLFESTYTGSMFGAGAAVFAVWGYVIAHTQPGLNEAGVETGIVEVNPPLVASLIGMQAKEVQEAIDYLTGPDQRSRSPGHDGRRLLPVGAFIFEVPTFPDYQRKQNPEARKEAGRERVRKHRAKMRGESVTHVTLGNACNATQTQTQTHTHHSDAPVQNPRKRGSVCEDEGFRRFWIAYDKLVGKLAASKAWKRAAPDAALANRIIEQALAYVQATPDKSFRKHPATWLNASGWEDEIVVRAASKNGIATTNAAGQRIVHPDRMPVPYNSPAGDCFCAMCLKARTNPPAKRVLQP